VRRSVETITAAERAERARLVAEASHSLEMAGLTVTEATKADGADFIAGRIGAADLGSRARARYGLDPA
jgi:hypothetical protein